MTRLCTVPRSSHSFLVLLSNSSRSQPIASTSIILVEHSLVSFLLYTIHERAFLNLHHMLRTVSPSAFLISAESVPKKCRTYGNSSKKSRFSNRKKIPRSFFLWCILSVNKVKTKIGYRHFKRVRWTKKWDICESNTSGSKKRKEEWARGNKRKKKKQWTIETE